MKVVAGYFDVPSIPATLAEFREYQRETIPTLRVGDDARAVASTVLAPPVPRALRPLVRVLNVVTVGLLPAELREQYGLRRSRCGCSPRWRASPRGARRTRC
jgi:uncharacterized protein (DUF2236 family)